MYELSEVNKREDKRGYQTMKDPEARRLVRMSKMKTREGVAVRADGDATLKHHPRIVVYFRVHEPSRPRTSLPGGRHALLPTSPDCVFNRLIAVTRLMGLSLAMAASPPVCYCWPYRHWT